MTWFLVFFAVSGFCGLVYEVVWLRLAMASFGVTTPLVSIVLSVFMGGLALGSRLAGVLLRRRDTVISRHPLRWYGVSELIIGLSAPVIPGELVVGRHALAWLGTGASWGSATYYLGSAFWVALTLLPPCICMGATFPLAMAAIRAKARRDQAERSFSYLYFANVAGAVIGTLCSAYVMIELFGFRRTLLVTSCLNGLLAVGAWALSMRSTPTADASIGSRPPPVTVDDSGNSPFLIPLFVTGLVSMAMEVVWVRQFTPYVGTVVYAFATILAIYLAATFMGSTAYRLWHRLSPIDPEWQGYSLLWVLAAFASLFPLAAADPRLPFAAQLTPTGGINTPLIGALRVTLGIVPICATIGFITPMLIDWWSAGDPDRAGLAYSINVLGCVIGPLLASFLFLPFTGERWSLIALALPLFAVAARALRGSRRFPVGIWAVAVVSAIALLSLTRDFETLYPKRIVRRDSTATVIAADGVRGKELLVNGVGMTVLTPITKMMAHLPMAFHGAPKNSLVVCFGMGTTFRSLVSWAVPATAVELVPSVPKVFAFYHPDADRVLASPNARVAIDDGRRFLERNPEFYDVITLDPPPPAEAAGSSLLYSREFYDIIKERLRPRGILQQWLPGAERAITSSVTRAVIGAFPYVRAFRYPDGSGVHFVASLDPLPNLTPAALAARLPPAAARDLVEWGPASTAEGQFAMILGNEVRPAAIIDPHDPVPTLSDDRPVNEYYFLRRTFPRL